MFLFKKNLNLKNNVIFIAEIGINHEGSIAKAKKMIDLAKKSGADAVKFQSYSLDKYCSIDEIDRYKRLKKFELKPDQFYELFKYSKKKGINFFSTAVTEDYVFKLNKYCEVIKVASGDMSFLPLIDNLIKTNSKIIISTGMHTEKEVNNLIGYISKKKGKKYLKNKLALMQCTVSYPTPTSEANVNVINNFKKKYNLTIGYSNHSLTMGPCLAAVANGAKIIEVHFTDTRKNKTFHDHNLSFEPKELKNLISISNDILLSMGNKNKKILDIEKKFLKIGKKGLIASRNLKKGSILRSKDIMYARPATFFSYEKKSFILGKQLSQDLNKGQLFNKKILKSV